MDQTPIIRLSIYLCHLNLRKSLPVPLSRARSLSVFHLKYDHFVTPAMPQNFGLYRGSFYVRVANLYLILSLRKDQNLVKCDFVTLLFLTHERCFDLITFCELKLCAGDVCDCECHELREFIAV